MRDLVLDFLAFAYILLIFDLIAELPGDITVGYGAQYDGGRGLVAGKDFATGDLILAERTRLVNSSVSRSCCCVCLVSVS